MMRTPARLDMEIRHRVLIRAAPEAVYDALATGEGIDGWFTAGSEIDGHAGGSYTLRWRDWGVDRIDAEERGPVREADLPRRWSFEWNAHLGSRTTVTFDITPRDDGTVVEVTETGYPDTPEGRMQFVDCATGWGEALTLLKMWLEHGVRY